MLITKELIISEFRLNDEHILNIYPYGSRIYNTASEKSDYDFIVVGRGVPVTKYPYNSADCDQLDSPNYPITINLYPSEESFEDRIKMHRISVLECLFLPPDKILKETVKFPFILHRKRLRESISEKASNSWVKAKKKFSDNQILNPEIGKLYEQDFHLAKKSLFHSLRIIDFGIQIATQGKIINYSSCCQLWQEILNNPSNNWQDYQNKYQQYYNSQMTEFRKAAPK